MRFDRVEHEQNWHDHSKDQSVLEMYVKSQFHHISSEFQSSYGLYETRKNPPTYERINQC